MWGDSVDLRRGMRFGRCMVSQEVQTDDALKVIANILPEVLSDAIFDKVLATLTGWGEPMPSVPSR